MPDEIETATETDTQEPMVTLAAPVRRLKPRAKKADADRLRGVASNSNDAAPSKARAVV